MHNEAEGISAKEVKSLLTLDNIRYIVQGLRIITTYYYNTTSMVKRSKIIELRDQLLACLDSIFSDPS
jgi:hypothetical protein